MSTNTARNSSKAQSSTRAFLPRSRGFHSVAGRGWPRRSLRLRSPGGMNRAIRCTDCAFRSARNLHRRPRVTASSTKGRPFRFNKEPTVYEAKEDNEHGENHKFADFTQMDRA